MKNRTDLLLSFCYTKRTILIICHSKSKKGVYGMFSKKKRWLTYYIILFFGSLIIQWLFELFTNGWSSKIFFKLISMLAFLALTYLLEFNFFISIYLRITAYIFYLFIVGTFASLVLYQNPVSDLAIFVYFFLSFIGGILWSIILHYLKKET